MKNRTKITEAVKFHGHLGPYLLLGILAGEFALKKLRAEKYFGIEVKVYGANRKPKSCLIDGLQLSTGATYGKGNICRIADNKIKILILNLKNRKKIILKLKKDLIDRLDNLKGHKESELFAMEIIKLAREKLFDFE